MKDLFSDLLQRSRGEDLPAPVVSSRFEPALEREGIWGEIDEFVSTRGGTHASATPAESPRSDRLHRAAPAAGGREAVTRFDRDEPEGRSDPRIEPAGDEQQQSPAPPAPSVLPADLQAIIAAALRRREPHVADQPKSAEPREGSRPVVSNDDGTTGERAEPGSIAIAEGVLPRDPAGATEPDRAAPPPTVEVRIGRIEISATPAPAPRPAPASRAARPSSAGVSLREYLARRRR